MPSYYYHFISFLIFILTTIKPIYKQLNAFMANWLALTRDHHIPHSYCHRGALNLQISKHCLLTCQRLCWLHHWAQYKQYFRVWRSYSQTLLVIYIYSSNEGCSSVINKDTFKTALLNETGLRWKYRMVVWITLGFCFSVGEIFYSQTNFLGALDGVSEMISYRHKNNTYLLSFVMKYKKIVPIAKWFGSGLWYMQEKKKAL